jgi:excisionase family DNA binding protein
MPFDMALSHRLPTPEETEKAQVATRVLGRLATKQGALSLRLLQNKHTEEQVIDLPPAVARMLLELLMHIGKGEAVTFVPVGAELSTQQAADVLNVSRPFFIKLLESNQIPHHKVGTHRRIMANDVFNYKSRRDKMRSKALDELARLGQEIDAE